MNNNIEFIIRNQFVDKIILLDDGRRRGLPRLDNTCDGAAYQQTNGPVPRATRH